jgi:acyl carrier protein phosphodiesterase
VSQNIEVSLLNPDEWARLRQIRVQALKENPEAFGANLNEVMNQSKEDWLKLYEKEDYLVASSNGQDVRTLYIEVLGRSWSNLLDRWLLDRSKFSQNWRYALYL